MYVVITTEFKFTDTQKNWLTLAEIFCTLADIFCTLSVPHCTFYLLPLYPAVPFCTILLNSTVPHYWLPLYPTVHHCAEHWKPLYPNVRYWIIFKSKTFNIIFSLIFILGCLIYSSALFINFYWYWMLRPQICFIWSCLLCQSLHHYHRKIISLISKVTKFVYPYIDDILRKTVQLRIYIM